MKMTDITTKLIKILATLRLFTNFCRADDGAENIVQGSETDPDIVIPPRNTSLVRIYAVDVIVENIKCKKHQDTFLVLV